MGYLARKLKENLSISKVETILQQVEWRTEYFSRYWWWTELQVCERQVLQSSREATLSLCKTPLSKSTKHRNNTTPKVQHNTHLIIFLLTHMKPCKSLVCMCALIWIQEDIRQQTWYHCSWWKQNSKIMWGPWQRLGTVTVHSIDNQSWNTKSYY